MVDSACNQTLACNHFQFIFICNFTEGQNGMPAEPAPRVEWKTITWKFVGWWRNRVKLCATGISCVLPLRYQEQSVSKKTNHKLQQNCGRPIKSHSFNPTPLKQTARLKKQVAFFLRLISLWCGLLHQGIRHSAASQDVPLITELLNQTQHFSELPRELNVGLSCLGTHTLVK